MKDSKYLKFAQRAESMGLKSHVVNGIYYYIDQFGEVYYKQLVTPDQVQTPFYGVFIKRNTLFPLFTGIVSDNYQFVGNQSAINKIKESMTNGSSIFEEKSLVSNLGAKLLHEIVIRNKTSISQVGDIYPQINIINSYCGTNALSLVFGISVYENTRRILSGSFKRFGTIKQNHFGSRSTVSTAIGNYIVSFNDRLVNLVQQNMHETLVEEDYMSILTLVEELGKRKRTDISAIIESICPKDSENKIVVSRWNLFSAITRYSTTQKNINMRILLENTAERCLVFPVEVSNILP